MSSRNENKSPLFGGVVMGALTGAAMAGFNYLAEMTAEAPTPVLGGEQHYYAWRTGKVFYHAGGAEDAPPMVLIHGFHAAASSYEWRYTFDFFVTQGYRVYAPDLPGFGLSDRPAMTYDDEVYIAFIGDFLRDVAQAPAVVIATSVGAALSIATAARHPDRVAKMVLIGALGVTERKLVIPGLTNAYNSLLATPLAGEAYFNLLTLPAGIRYFMKKFGFYDAEQVTDELVEHHFNLAHMPNARYAPAAFISGAAGSSLPSSPSPL